MLQTALLLLLLTASVRCAPGGAEQRKVSVLQGRIVNGEEAEPGEFPHMVLLQWNGAKRCGASILNEQWALTSASCVYITYGTYEALSGTINLNEGGTRHAVTEIHSHLGYNPDDSWLNDIAVFKVSPDFPIDGVNVAPIQLPEPAEEVPDGVNVTVIGWGDLWYGGPQPDNLRKVDLGVVNQEECQAVWGEDGYAIYPTQMCAARFEEKNYDSCYGDSGGPLLYEGKILGIASWGYECATPPYPSVATRVSMYINWIIENTNGTLVPH
ncbi:mite allergen Eur m 3-like [Schistocerca nitens]|uniref:mite allergen Eur m 3-like n=1 Tax=Schistocerca nitens TaxID=7011 RepID=UPI002119B1C4|nr:mite allergen Eur m 3-like [Schistocerca nitens]